MKTPTNTDLNLDSTLDSSLGEIFNNQPSTQEEEIVVIDTDIDSNGDEVNYDFSKPTIDEDEVIKNATSTKVDTNAEDGKNDAPASKQVETKVDLEGLDPKGTEKRLAELETENIKLTALVNVYKEKYSEISFKYSLLQEQGKKVNATADNWLQDNSELIDNLGQVYSNTFGALDYKLIEDVITDTDLSAVKRQTALRNMILEGKYQFDSLFGKGKIDIARAKVRHIVSKNNLKPVIEKKVLDYFEQKFYNQGNREDSSAIEAVLRRPIPELGRDISKYAASIKVKQAQKPDSDAEIRIRALEEENRLLKLRGNNTTSPQDNETTPARNTGRSFNNSEYVANTTPQFSKPKQTTKFNGRYMSDIAATYGQ